MREAKPREAAPRDMAELDAEIDKDLEARLAKLIESVEAGDPALQAQSDMFGAGGDGSDLFADQEDFETDAEPNVQETKAKSKEELLKALRGMQ